MISRISWGSAKRRAGRIYGFSGRSFFVPAARCQALPCWGARLLSVTAAFFALLQKKVRGGR